MNVTGLRSRISGAVLMFAVIAGINIATAPAAHAQWHRNENNRDGRPNDDSVRWQRERTKQYAYLLGYHNSYAEGREAAENRARVNFRDIQEYRDGTNGYLVWMGDHDTYRDGYRRGFEEGFKDGQSGRARRFGRADVERVLGDRLKNVYDGDDNDYNDDRWHRDRRRDDHRGGGPGRGDNDDRGRGRDDRNDRYRIAEQNGREEGFRDGRNDRENRRRYDFEHAGAYRNATGGYRPEYGDRGTYQQAFREGYRRGYEEGYRGR